MIHPLLVTLDMKWNSYEHRGKDWRLGLSRHTQFKLQLPGKSMLKPLVQHFES